MKNLFFFSKYIYAYIILTDPPYCFITLSAKTKPRIPAISWSRKITVRQTQNCKEEGEEEEEEEETEREIMVTTP